MTGGSIYSLRLDNIYNLLVVKYLNIIDTYSVLQCQIERIESFISIHGNKLTSVPLKRCQDKPNRIQANIGTFNFFSILFILLCILFMLL